MPAETIVFFDLEATGKDPTQHTPIQFAAIAVDAKTFEERDALMIRVKFNLAKAEQEALAVNSYDTATWEREAVHPREAVKAIRVFLRRYADKPMTSKKGTPYTVALPAGHNINGFDIPMLKLMFQRYGGGNSFLPMAFQGIDTFTLATTWEQLGGGAVDNLRLGTLAAHFGIDAGGAHDALEDVRMNIPVARCLLEGIMAGVARMPWDAVDLKDLQRENDETPGGGEVLP